MHFEASGERQRKQVEHWKNRLIELLESRLLERALGGAGGEARLAELAAEGADRKKDPFSAGEEKPQKNGLSRQRREKGEKKGQKTKRGKNPSKATKGNNW